jgi:acetolactate synthase I/II/III large subunit
MKVTGAEIIIKLLEQHGIGIIAGIPGGSNLPMYNALYKSSIRHILARHEQGAGFIAQGMARSTGKPAVCFATSGPGSTNLVTAIADAKLDSIPLIAITGQVASSLIGTDAFQEADIYGMTIPITKHNFLVHHAHELLTVIPEAFRIATEGRPGPVLIDVPKDVQIQTIELDAWPEPTSAAIISSPTDAAVLEQAADSIHRSQRPVLYIGGGIIHSDAHLEIGELSHKNNIPVASTLMGLGCVPDSDPLFLGMLGMHGAMSTNRILHESDLLIALGVRFDDRATGLVKQFCPNAHILHIDIDTSELSKIKHAHLEIPGNVKDVLRQLLPLIHTNTRDSWRSQMLRIKQQYPEIAPKASDTFHPINLIRTIASLAPHDAIVTTDVGQHQMWTAQAYPFRHPRTFLTSGGLGTMGFGLPTAIGAALANPGRKVICFTGDGSILMNIQELATLAELKLNITIILLNNGHLGLVRQQQELFYHQHYIASKFEQTVDYPAIAKGFGIQSFDLATMSDPHHVLQQSLASAAACLVNIPIDPYAMVTPMVPPGKSNIEVAV